MSKNKGLVQNKFPKNNSDSIIPPARELSDYEKIKVGFADRILKTVEKQSNHRIEIEKKIVDKQLKLLSRGQIFAFIISLIGFSITAGGFYLGYAWQAVVLGAGMIVSLVTIFVRPSKESEEPKK
jgi:uncharacterized membrane protein